MRHLEAWRNGEKLDESGLSHLVHAACNLLFIINKEEKREKKMTATIGEKIYNELMSHDPRRKGEKSRLITEIIALRDEARASQRNLVPAADPTGDARMAFGVVADRLDDI